MGAEAKKNSKGVEVPPGLSATKPLFFKDTYQFEDKGEVLYVSEIIAGVDGDNEEARKSVVVLDQTIMYPQGGKGWI